MAPAYNLARSGINDLELSKAMYTCAAVVVLAEAVVLGALFSKMVCRKSIDQSGLCGRVSQLDDETMIPIACILPMATLFFITVGRSIELRGESRLGSLRQLALVG